jgi:cytochrome b
MIHTVKEIHEISFYVMLALILSHIAGVIIAENRDEKGIISNMVGKSE